jgi:hypothetical protein
LIPEVQIAVKVFGGTAGIPLVDLCSLLLLSDSFQ